MKHPIQRIAEDEHGVVRFTKNTIVNHLLAELEKHDYTLNNLAVDCSKHNRDDWDQFYQLIGYSVCNAPCSHDLLVMADAIAESEDMTTSEEKRATAAEDRVKELKDLLRPLASEAFGKHPDDLE